MELLKPHVDHIPAYVDALQRGWSPNNLRPEAREEELAEIAGNPVSFIARFDDPMAKAGPVILPDGSSVARLPSIGRWIWDGGFCGFIDLRWKPGTDELPPTCSGHIGMASCPGGKGRGWPRWR